MFGGQYFWFIKEKKSIRMRDSKKKNVKETCLGHTPADALNLEALNKKAELNMRISKENL